MSQVSSTKQSQVRNWLPKAAAFALAAAAAFPASAVTVTALSNFTLDVDGEVSFIGPATGDGTTKYFSFAVAPPVSTIAISLTKAGTAFTSWTGSVYQASGACISTDVSCALGTKVGDLTYNPPSLNFGPGAAFQFVPNSPGAYILEVTASGGGSWNGNITAGVPAPGVVALLGIGMFGLGLTRRRDAGLASTQA